MPGTLKNLSIIRTGISNTVAIATPSSQKERKNIGNSMPEENHCYENALAERVNGILKDEFYLDQTFASVEEAKRATKNAIKLYNSKRLHLSLNYKTPNNVHLNAA